MPRKRINALPDIPPDVGPLRRWVGVATEAIEVLLGRRGDPGEAAVRFNDLIDMKILTGVSRINLSFLPEFEGGGDGGFGSGPQLPTTQPPKPTGFTADGTFNGIFLDWDLVPSRPDITLTEIRRSEINDFSTALTIGSTSGSNYFDIILGNTAQTFYYWIRHISANGLSSAWSDVASATTEPDVQYLLDTLSQSISENQFVQALNNRIDLIDADELTPGSVNARIRDEAILREDGDSGLSQQINTVQTSLENDIASVEQTLTARIDTNEDGIVEIGAQATLLLDVNGYLAGYTIYNTGEESAVVWRVDTFAIGSPSNPDYFPFIFSGGDTPIELFREDFNTSPSTITSEWESYDGALGELQVITSDESNNGGAFLRVGDNSGNDERWMIHGTNIPYDPTKLYRMRLSIRRIAGGGHVYVGWAGVAADGTTLVNLEGDNTHGSQHYHVAENREPSSVWQEFTGYTQGFGATRPENEGESGGKNSPKGMHPDVAFIRPLVLVNYANVAGITDIDRIHVDILDPSNGVLYLDTTHILNASIENAMIKDATITSAKIADASIVNAKISDATITNAKIADATITAAKIALATIDTARIQNAAITNAKIANLSVSNAKIQNAAITNAKIDNAAVSTLKLQGQAVTIPSSSFTSGTLSVGSLTAVVGVSYTSTGNPVYVHASTVGSANSSVCIGLRITRTNPSFSDIYPESAWCSDTKFFSAGLRDTLTSTGFRRYELRARRVQGSSGTSVYRRAIFALETKR